MTVVALLSSGGLALIPSSGVPLITDQDDISALAIAPDKRNVLLADHHGSFFVYPIYDEPDNTLIDLAKQLSVVRYSPETMLFSPDGNFLAIGSNGEISLWDVPAKRELSRIKPYEQEVTCLCFSSDSETLGSVGTNRYIRGSDMGKSNLMLWQSIDGKYLTTVKYGDQFKYQSMGLIYHVEFSPDSSMIASIDRSDSLILWGLI